MVGNWRMMRRRFHRNRLVAGLLAIMVLFSGCSAFSGDSSQNELASKDGGAMASVMGRYMEEVISVEYGNYYPIDLLPAKEGIYLARDRGMDERLVVDGTKVKAQKQLSEAFVNAAGDAAISNMAVAENGARIFSIFEIGDENKKGRYRKYFLTAEGEMQEWNDYIEEEKGAYFWYGKDGYFYVNSWSSSSSDAGNALYRVDVETGETEYLWEFPWLVTYLSVCGDYLFAGYQDGLMIYSLSSKERLSEDSVLMETLKKYMGDISGNQSHAYLIAASKEEESIYVLTEEGLFYHVMYGTVMEQVIEGSLCGIGDISKQFAAMCMAEDEFGDMPVFYLAYDSGDVVRFVYNADVPSVPDTIVRIYSLHDDSNVRQAVIGYQGENPNLYVQYEVGMTEEDGQTEEDALKTLATQIASGSGPDVLVMDGIPYESYVKKGVLRDLTEFYAEISASGSYFDNIIDCFYRDEKIYSIPAAFQFTILMGEEEKVEGVDSLEELASFLDRMTTEETSKIGLLTEERILNAMGMVSGGTWIDEEGELDKGALSRFLMICHRIYDADRAGLSGESLQEEIALREARKWYWGSSSVYDFKNGNPLYCINTLNDSYTYWNNPLFMGSMGGDIVNELNVLLTQLKYLEKDYRILSDEGIVCIPVSMLAVNSATEVQSEAEAFLKYILGAGFQESTVLSGVPINKDALYAMEENNPDPHGYWDGYTSTMLGSVNVSSSDYVILDVCWASDEEFQKFNDMLDSINQINICDDMVYNTVMELGEAAVNGEKSIEETVEAIAKKVQLYLAE